MPKARAIVAKYWQPCAMYGGLLLIVGWLLWWRLGTLTHGAYSGAESASSLLAGVNLHDTFQNILHNPFGAPFTLFAHALSYLHPHSMVIVRLTATLFGLLTLTTFFWLVRAWHGQRAAVLGTALFGASAWFLHAARLGTPDVLFLCLLSLAACSVWFKQSGGALPVLLCLVLAAAFLYVPGMVWFMVAGVLWQWKAIDAVFKKHLWMVTLGGLLLLAILAPLGWAIYRTPALAKVFVGLPATGWPQPVDVLHRIADVPLALFLRTPLQPEHWLAHLSVLDAFSLAMFFLGGFVYFKHRGLVRTQLLVVILLIGTALVGLGTVSLSVIVPFVYVVVAAGIGLLLDRWYMVFPRNPIAQFVGLGLVSLTVLASCWYGCRHYFVAWPAAPATQATFTVKPPPSSGTIEK